MPARPRHARAGLVGRAAAGGVLIGLVLAAVVEASPPGWSPPQSLGSPATGAAGLVFARDGTALLSARIPRRGGFAGRLVVRAPDGRVARDLSTPDDLVAAPVGYGGDRVVLVRERIVAHRKGPQRVRLSITRGTVGSPLTGPTLRVATFDDATLRPVVPAIAVSRRGEVAVVWSQLVPGRTSTGDRVRVAIARPGHGFARPLTLASGVRDESDAPLALALAYGSAGQLVLAFGGERHKRLVIEARLRSPHGRWGRPQVLGRRLGRDTLTVAAGAVGHAAVAWGTQDPGEETSQPWVVRAALLGGNRFGAAQLLDPGGRSFVDLPEQMALTMTPAGRATVAWSNAIGKGYPVDHYPLRVATSDPSGRFTAPAQLDDSGALGGAATDPSGTTVLTWTHFTGQFGGDGPSQIMAALLPSRSSASEPPETVSGVDFVSAAGPTAGFDPRSDAPAIAWTTPPAAPEVPNAFRFAIRNRAATGG